MKKSILKEIKSWILLLVISIGLAFLINKLVLFNVSTPTGSMENTIKIGERVATFRLAYLFSNPERGDIVVFPFPDDEREDRLKRIIGLPGETIEGKNGMVYINGKPLEESYLKEAMDPENVFGPFDIPEGSYFMMGDNRNTSLDARDWDNKFVRKNKIRGKAIFKYPKFQLFN